MGLAERPWPTTESEVHCYRLPCEQWYGRSAPCEDRSTSLEWHGYDQEVLLSTEGWDGSQECRPSGGPVGAENQHPKWLRFRRLDRYKKNGGSYESVDFCVFPGPVGHSCRT